MTAPVESALSETLVREADAMPVPEDAWPRFAEREGRHRRNRRIRTAVAAGLVAAAVGVQTNLVPLPGWAPGIAVASPWSALAHQPPRSDLARDSAWLASLRRRVGGFGRLSKPGLWKVADRDAIEILYAADIGRYRVAAVLVPLRLGLLTDWQLIWYEGPAGATAGQMTDAGNQEAKIPVATRMLSLSNSSGYVVVLGPVGSTVTIHGDYTYSPKGVVEYRQLAASDGSGVAAAVLPPSDVGQPGLTTDVTQGGKLLYSGIVTGDFELATTQRPTDEMVMAAAQGARGPLLDRAVLGSFMERVLFDSRLSAARATIRLRWSGRINGQPAALLTVQPTGGGVIAYAFHGSPGNNWMDMRLLLPAEGVERRPLAWRLRAEGGDGVTGAVVVVAPAGAATATVTVAGGAPVPVALDAAGSGTTTVPADRAATVTAYSANGSTLASTPVPLFENDSSRPPGDTPGTRVVE